MTQADYRRLRQTEAVVGHQVGIYLCCRPPLYNKWIILHHYVSLQDKGTGNTMDVLMLQLEQPCSKIPVVEFIYYPVLLVVLVAVKCLKLAHVYFSQQAHYSLTWCVGHLCDLLLVVHGVISTKNKHEHVHCLFIEALYCC